MSKSLPFSAVVFVINDENNVLSITRKDNGKLSVPGGKLEKEEWTDEAAVRELFEETGLVFEKEELHPIQESVDNHGHITFAFSLKYNKVKHGIPYSKEREGIGGIVSWESMSAMCCHERCEFPLYNRNMLNMHTALSKILTSENNII